MYQHSIFLMKTPSKNKKTRTLMQTSTPKKEAKAKSKNTKYFDNFSPT